MANEPERVSVRLPKEMADELRAKAHVQNTTLTTVIVDLLRTASFTSASTGTVSTNYLGSQTLAGGEFAAPSCQHPRVRQIQGGAWYCPGCNRRFPTRPKT